MLNSEKTRSEFLGERARVRGVSDGLNLVQVIYEKKVDFCGNSIVNRIGDQPPNPRDFLRHHAGVQSVVLWLRVVIVGVFDETDGGSAETQLPEG